MGVIGIEILYAVRDVILSNVPARSKRHGNAVTLVCALQHGSSDVTR